MEVTTATVLMFIAIHQFGTYVSGNTY